MQAFGHLPTQGETVTISGFRFKVLEADERRLQLVQAVIVGSEDESADIPMASAG